MPTADSGATADQSPESTVDVQLGLDLDSVTIPDLQRRMDSGTITSAALTAAYLRRVAAVDPLLRAFIAVDPTAGEQAAASDRRRAQQGARSALEGIPVLVKDNVDLAGMPTTVGSRAMLGARPTADAEVVRRLREAGAVLIGKANLSEWANHRSTHSTSGWSAVGGLTRNPHDLRRNTSGSSSGSAAGVAASLAQVAIGTETDGSIVSPASMTGVVGIKPTLGLVSRRGVVPITSAQDTAGPMARHVIDAALTLGVICGRDEHDPATLTGSRSDAWPAAWSPPDDPLTVLRGTRLGLWRMAGGDAMVDALVEAAATALETAGATLIEVTFDEELMRPDERLAMVSEFSRDLNAHLAATPGDHPRTLAELVAFNLADEAELAHFGQEIFLDALAGPDAMDAVVTDARSRATETARRLLSEAFAEQGLDAVVAPTGGPAFVTDLGSGDAVEVVGTSTLAAVAGSPHVTVPMGLTADERLPVGLSFLAPRWSDARLTTLAWAFEQLTHARRPPTYRP